MRKVRFSSPGVLLILAVIVAAGVYLLDSLLFEPSVARQKAAALRRQAAKVENIGRWVLRAEQRRLASLCAAVSRHGGPGGSAALDGEAAALDHVDAAWVGTPDGTVAQGWCRDPASLSVRQIERSLAAGGEPVGDAGLMRLGETVVVFARGDLPGRAGASAAPARLYLARRLNGSLLTEMGAAVPANLHLLGADALAEAAPAGESGGPVFWPLASGRLAVAWPVTDAAGARLGYLRADFPVGEIQIQGAVVRRTVLAILLLSGGATLLVILGAKFLLANPIRRLLNRVHRVEAGDYPSEEEFTRHLHAEPLALAVRLQRAFKAITRLSKTDELTGLANRRQFDQALGRAYLEARRYNRPLSVMVMDIDLFKAINDTGGHHVGDKLLKVVAGIIESCCRKADLPARVGGDEFHVLLPETAAAGAAVVAERILTAVAERTVAAGASQFNTTMSIGIADFNAGRIEEAHDLVALADRALYAAKQLGRNRFAQAHDLNDATWAENGQESDRVDGLRGKLAGLDIQFKGLFVRALQEIVQALESRDPHMADHARKVQHYAVLTAREMNLPEQLTKRVELAALIHDIGMLALPDAIALCPGRLTRQQFEAMKRHPLIGARILEGMEFLELLIPAVRCHHERLDGEGYPDGLAGQAIPLPARIVAVADVFDAMTSPRAFRGAKSVEESLAELDAAAGTQFDPAVVKAFLAQAEKLGEKLTDVPLPQSSPARQGGSADSAGPQARTGRWRAAPVAPAAPPEPPSAT